MKIATWNVNSVRARIDGVYGWVRHNRPDVLCLQETKCVDGQFPVREFELLGYRAVYYGQKSYNGVAILSPHAIETPHRGFVDGGAGEDVEARLISATVCGVRVLCAYVPNGHEVGSAKYAYKLKWLERLRREALDARHSADELLAVCGDFNVAPDDRDVWDARLWRGSILCHEQVRGAYEEVVAFGLVDTWRALNPDAPSAFTWWDYRAGSLTDDLGVRIDMVLATEALAARCSKVAVDREERARDKPSDHAPVVAHFDL